MNTLTRDIWTGSESSANSGDREIAVIIVDMQEHSVNNLTPSIKDNLITTQLKILRHCARVSIPVIALEFFLGGLRNQGHTMEEILEVLYRVPRYRVIEKSTASGFLARELNAFLIELGVKKLLITGIFASYCVYRTALDSVEHGYTVWTGDELIGDAPDMVMAIERRQWYESCCMFNENWRAVLGM